MSARLNSRNRFLYFSTARNSGDGESIAAASPQATAWSGTLPATDTYVVRVYLVRAETRRNRRPVNFRIRFAIN